LADSSALVLLDKHEGIATLTLNRPEKLNALTGAMIVELVERLDEVRADYSVRSVVLTGAGRAFCAGDDPGHEERFEFGYPDRPQPGAGVRPRQGTRVPDHGQRRADVL
jgi:enoyl-CoA hydratase/carnithine racemase